MKRSMHRMLRTTCARIEQWRLRRSPTLACHLTLPDFLGIGVQKSGTTWLHENLRRHPSIFLPDRKELHYFDEHFDRTIRSYAAEFAGADGRVKGEITPAYSILPVERIRFIHAVMPDVRLILLLRNPIDRAWSSAVMELAAFTGRNADDVPEAEYIDFLKGAPSMQRSDFFSTLDNWLSVFPDRQLFIGFFDEIERDPRALLLRLFRHVGVLSDVDWDKFSPEKTIVPNVEPGSDRVAFSREIATARTTGNGRHPMPDSVRSVLADMYTRDLERLAERFGEPCTGWSSGK